MNLKSVFIAGVLSLASLQANAGMLTPTHPTNNCTPMYHAKTQNNSSDVFMCATESNILFAFGNTNSKYPETLLTVGKHDVQIRSYNRGLSRIAYDVFIPNGDRYEVLSFRPEGTYLKTYQGKLNTLGNVRRDIDSIAGIAFNRSNESNAIWSVKGPLEVQEDL